MTAWAHVASTKGYQKQLRDMFGDCTAFSQENWRPHLVRYAGVFAEEAVYVLMACADKYTKQMY